MHPYLAHELHPDCVKQIDDLMNCHKDRPYAKFWGACNDYKRLLDVCLGEEYERKRKANLELGRKRLATLKANFEAKIDE